MQKHGVGTHTPGGIGTRGMGRGSGEHRPWACALCQPLPVPRSLVPSSSWHLPSRGWCWGDLLASSPGEGAQPRSLPSGPPAAAAAAAGTDAGSPQGAVRCKWNTRRSGLPEPGTRFASASPFSSSVQDAHSLLVPTGVWLRPLLY